MTKQRNPETDGRRVHLSDEGGHLFDQTNGIGKFDFEASRIETTGLSDEERAISAAAIMNIASGSPS